jgi:DNA repair protein RecO (recombination protein O)
MSEARRVIVEPAYLLHQRPFRDTSRILDFFARDHGRISLFVRGARRTGAGLGAVLQPFRPLLICWSGKPDGGTLRSAEVHEIAVPLAAARLMSGFYLNELLLRLLERQDAHPALYDAYALAIARLGAGEDEARTLRLFEKRLLEEMGYGVDYSVDASSGARVVAGRYYQVRPHQGVCGVAEPADSPYVFAGEHLLSIASDDLSDSPSLRAARRLLRAALDESLDGRELLSREVAVALRRHEAGPHEESKR